MPLARFGLSGPFPSARSASRPPASPSSAAGRLRRRHDRLNRPVSAARTASAAASASSALPAASPRQALRSARLDIPRRSWFSPAAAGPAPRAPSLLPQCGGADGAAACSSIRLMCGPRAPSRSARPAGSVDLRGVDRVGRSCRALEGLALAHDWPSAPAARAGPRLAGRTSCADAERLAHRAGEPRPTSTARRSTRHRVPAPGAGAVASAAGQDRHLRVAAGSSRNGSQRALPCSGADPARRLSVPVGRAAPLRRGRPSGRAMVLLCGEAVQRVAAPGFRWARRGADNVEDQQLRIVPGRHQARSVLVAEIGRAPPGRRAEMRRRRAAARTGRGDRLFRRRPSRRRHRARGAAGCCASRGSCRPRRPPRRHPGEGSSCRCRQVRRPAPPCRMRATAAGDRCAAAGRPPSAGRR